ncbi:MAG: peptidylprolyl isomerase [Deltaproteobacteria bacterium]|nr:peptidylprolyl isomerase [Deltaproteobacteria bacterium]
MNISKGKVVNIHYALNDTAGEVLESSEGQAPLEYLHGHGNIIAGLEKALDGKAAGDKLKAVIPPEDGYGIRDETLVKELPLSSFQGPDEVAVGAQFQAETSQGPRLATVTKMDDKNATVDLNHPLADQTLSFDIDVVDVREATEEELSHGHAHGPEGHDH